MFMIRTEYSEKNIDTEKKRPYKYWFVQNVYDREKDCRYFFAANMNAMIKWNCHENTTEIVYKTDGEPVRNELYGS